MRRAGGREERAGGREERIGERKERGGGRQVRTGGREVRAGGRKEKTGERKERAGARSHHPRSLPRGLSVSSGGLPGSRRAGRSGELRSSSDKESSPGLGSRTGLGS